MKTPVHGQRILAVCYGAAHVEMLLPLFAPLRERHTLDIIAINTAAAALRQRGIAFTPVGELVDRLGWREPVERWGRQAVASGIGPLTLGVEESVAYLGMNLHDLALQHGEADAMAIYTQQGRGAFHPVHFARQVVQHLSPDLVLATSAPRLERAIVEAAGNASIPSLVLVDQYPAHEMQWLKSPDFGSRLAVLDASVRQMLVEQGRPAGDIVVTGNPAFDALQAIRAVPRATPPRIVYLSQSEPFAPAGSPRREPLNAAVLAALLAAAERHDWVVIYRPHPNEQQMALQHPRLLTHRSGSVGLVESLQGAAAAVTETSTAGIQALLAGIPLVQLGFTRRTRRPPFEHFGSTQVAVSPDEIEPALCQALAEPFQSTQADAQATANVLQLIAGLLGTHGAASPHTSPPSTEPHAAC